MHYFSCFISVLLCFVFGLKKGKTKKLKNHFKQKINKYITIPGTIIRIRIRMKQKKLIYIYIYIYIYIINTYK